MVGGSGRGNDGGGSGAGSGGGSGVGGVSVVDIAGGELAVRRNGGGTARRCYGCPT